MRPTLPNELPPWFFEQARNKKKHTTPAILWPEAMRQVGQSKDWQDYKESQDYKGWKAHPDRYVNQVKKEIEDAKKHGKTLSWRIASGNVSSRNKSRRIAKKRAGKQAKKTPPILSITIPPPPTPKPQEILPLPTIPIIPVAPTPAKIETPIIIGHFQKQETQLGTQIQKEFLIDSLPPEIQKRIENAKRIRRAYSEFTLKRDLVHQLQHECGKSYYKALESFREVKREVEQIHYQNEKDFLTDDLVYWYDGNDHCIYFLKPYPPKIEEIMDIYGFTWDANTPCWRVELVKAHTNGLNPHNIYDFFEFLTKSKSSPYTTTTDDFFTPEFEERQEFPSSQFKRPKPKRAEVLSPVVKITTPQTLPLDSYYNESVDRVRSPHTSKIVLSANFGCGFILQSELSAHHPEDKVYFFVDKAGNTLTIIIKNTVEIYAIKLNITEFQDRTLAGRAGKFDFTGIALKFNPISIALKIEKQHNTDVCGSAIFIGEKKQVEVSFTISSVIDEDVKEIFGMILPHVFIPFEKCQDSLEAIGRQMKMKRNLHRDFMGIFNFTSIDNHARLFLQYITIAYDGLTRQRLQSKLETKTIANIETDKKDIKIKLGTLGMAGITHILPMIDYYFGSLSKKMIFFNLFTGGYGITTKDFLYCYYYIGCDADIRTWRR